MRWNRLMAKGLGLIIFIGLSINCSMLYSEVSMSPGNILPNVNIKTPITKEIKNYLGVKDDKSFSLLQIEAKLMVIEIFEVFCPVCQKNAPQVNQLFKFIREDRTLKKDVKMMGIVLGTQPDELSVYKEKFKVEFPLFLDPKKEIQNKLEIKYVPIVVVINKKGKILMSHMGPIENIDPFLAEIRKISQAQ
jgi:peroxiredoxin